MSNEIEKNKLFDLIHGLSKTDKAYLKKYSRIFIPKGDTKHKTYYSILEKMDKYSQETLKKKLEKHGGYRRFKNADHEIYSQILEDLVILKSKKRATWQYYIEHMKLGYLFFENKQEETIKQFDTLFRIKEEAKNASIDYLYHKFHYHHIASLNNARISRDIEELDHAEDMLRQSLDNLKIEFLLEAAVFNFDNYRFSSFNRTKTEFLNHLTPFKEKYLDVLPKNLETDKWKMLSVYYYFFCHFYTITGDIEQLDIYSERFYDTFNANQIKNSFYHEYSNAVYFRAGYFIRTKNPKVFALLDDYKEYIDNCSFFDMKSYFYLMHCQLTLLAYNTFGDNLAIEDFAKKEKESYLSRLKSSTIRVTLSTDLQWAISLFRLKKYKEVQVFLDKIFDALGKINEMYNKVLVTARILDIMIHFELKNYENIKYYIDNLENEMKRNNQLIEFDKAFFSHLRKLNQQLFARKTPQKEEFIQWLQKEEKHDRMESYLSFLNVEEWLSNLT